ncbi:OsmC family protein [[Pseudomonas] carboxydohydrogena]|uniref:OsmC family protein n=1 Tax=Afipia carboxydohydrogena TaxID=290 RepID=A0ABY8BMX2_AFICR|nr:OsmC family protein [[Pseudomonas] carboxydohydrogena]WEF51335.1 OsmC family protein [[Pseudomonas] carboxydohydrogena]
MKVKTFGSATWSGGIKDGQGAISTKSGALTNYPYGLGSRYEGKPGSSPEELLGAAHAACFTMNLSRLLTEAGFRAERMDTSADVTLEIAGDSFTITLVHLTFKGAVPGIDQQTFDGLIARAKSGCPVSKLFNCTITLDASLVS